VWGLIANSGTQPTPSYGKNVLLGLALCFGLQAVLYQNFRTREIIVAARFEGAFFSLRERNPRLLGAVCGVCVGLGFVAAIFLRFVGERPFIYFQF